MTPLQPPGRQIFSVQHKNGHEELTHVHHSVRSLVEETIGGARLAIGCIYLWNESATENGKQVPVEVVDGQFWGKSGVSNHWSWRKLNLKGEPSGAVISDYDNKGAFAGPVTRDEAIGYLNS